MTQRGSAAITEHSLAKTLRESAAITEHSLAMTQEEAPQSQNTA